MKELTTPTAWRTDLQNWTKKFHFKFTWNSWEKIFGAMASFGNNLVENTENGES